MPFASGDILEFILKGDFQGVVGTRNVFHYKLISVVDMDDDPFAAMGFAASTLWEALLPDIVAITAVSQGYTELTAKVLTGDNADLQNTYINTARLVGDVGSDSLPPQDAWGFRYQGAGGAQRNGYKRFCGVPEARQEQGRPSTSATVALAALAATLRADVSILDDADPTPLTIGIMTPVIVKKVAGGLDPDDIVVIASWEPVGVVAYGIGSQNTRKFGRGI